MSQVKICPSCGFENPLTEAMCGRCMADISGINPIDPDVPANVPESAINVSVVLEEPIDDPSATVIERKKKLRFELSDGSGGFSVESGAVLGREGEGKKYLIDGHISRRHARVLYNDTWTIEDLNSSNGTWVNERKLEIGEKCPIGTGDNVALSHFVLLKVME